MTAPLPSRAPTRRRFPWPVLLGLLLGWLGTHLIFTHWPTIKAFMRGFF